MKTCYAGMVAVGDGRMEMERASGSGKAFEAGLPLTSLLHGQLDAMRAARISVENQIKRFDVERSRLLEMEIAVQRELANSISPEPSSKKPHVISVFEEEAWLIFRTARWAGSGGGPVCPHCFECDVEAVSRSFSCRACGKRFSVTTGTLFASPKLPLRTYLVAMASFSSSANGSSVLDISRELGCDFRTAYVLCRNLREAARLRSIGRHALRASGAAIWQETGGRIPYERRLAHLLFHALNASPARKRNGHWHRR